MTSAPPIGFEYRASRLLLAALTGIGFLGLVAVFNSGIPGAFRIVPAVVIVAICAINFRRLSRSKVRTVLWRADGSVHLGLRATANDDKREVGARLHSSNVLGPLIVLELRWSKRNRATLWLLPDNLDADTRRRLRVRLNASVLSDN